MHASTDFALLNYLLYCRLTRCPGPLQVLYIREEHMPLAMQIQVLR